MLESKRNRSSIQDTSSDSLRKSWVGLFRSFFSNTGKISRRLPDVGSTELPRGLDEEVPEDVSQFNTEVTENMKNTREETYAQGFFEWVKTERSGEICKFKNFTVENDIEYVVFEDSSRVRADLVGDVVLVHQHESEIIGAQNEIKQFVPVTNNVYVEPPKRLTNLDPVTAILEKTKKRSEKISLTLVLKIPAPELYNVIKDNFENTDEILLQNIMDQIHDNLLKDALKKELQNIYSTKKKKINNATV